jgi:hypothetical protein
MIMKDAVCFHADCGSLPSVLLASVPSQERLLRQKAQPVTWADIANSDDIRQAERELQTALQDFRDTHGFGRAIAAPQIGHHLRMIALNLGQVWRCLMSWPWLGAFARCSLLGFRFLVMYWQNSLRSDASAVCPLSWS